MNKLENARIEINKIDKEMAKLFEQRMKAVEDVIEYKIENNMDIFDSSREKEVIEKNTKLLENDKYSKYYVEFIENLMNISKKYQKKISEK
ncbi:MULTISPECIES: chorismate mutase [Fusobacterium]|uniref:Chorismate mutase n=1 Tax=Fusobacterium hominis TaxID=2764326 RepID=A0A7G9GV06_9FUSO|nr:MULTISPECIES: chorismate mutase [Fusobacterium]QNM14638.1 chorismate mutase [Fusobacterium hominis]